MTAANIFIKGQIGIPFFDEFGVEGTYTTLTDIIAQAEAQKDAVAEGGPAELEARPSER